MVRNIYIISVLCALVMQSEANQFNWACLQCSIQHRHTEQERNFSGPALLSGSEILTYELLGSQLTVIIMQILKTEAMRFSLMTIG